jgi:hypothetical protein
MLENVTIYVRKCDLICVMECELIHVRESDLIYVRECDLICVRECDLIYVRECELICVRECDLIYVRECDLLYGCHTSFCLWLINFVLSKISIQTEDPPYWYMLLVYVVSVCC